MSNPRPPLGAPVPPKVREPVMDFALLMESRLRRHDDDRGERGWIGCDTDWLVSRTLSELGELLYALSRKRAGGSLDEVRWECADAANFLMMIADQHRPMKYARPRPKPRRRKS